MRMERFVRGVALNISEEGERMRRGLLIVGVLLLLSVIPLYAAAPPTVGLSLSTLNNPFFVDLRDGAQAAAKKMNVNLVVVDAQNDSAREASQIEDLIQKKVAVIAINPTDSDAIVPTIKKINAARIPVITVDRGANGGVVAAHIASDNVAGGKMAAQYVAKRLKGKGSVVMLEGIAGTSAARDRGKGFRDGLKAYPSIRLVAVQTADFDRAKGLSVMENILRGEFSCGERGRAASLRVGSPAHPRNSPEQISGDPEAERNARARCSGPPCTTPLDYAPCTGPDPPRRGAR